MDKLLIEGQKILSGEVRISRAKNSCLPLMFATLLTEEEVILKDLPQLMDIGTTKKLLSELGVKIADEGDKTSFCAKDIQSLEAIYDIVRKMRASILTLGPLLTRFGKAKVSLPGGCAIGTRPVDIHLEGMKSLGAEISIESGYVLATCSKLKGNKISLSFPSVGATENLMMAASLATGETLIENAAREPEIVDLAQMLIKMGVQVEGAGTSKILIQGKNKVLGCTHTPIGDRIEAATYILAGLMTKSPIKIVDFVPDHLRSVLDVLKRMGAKFEESENSLEILNDFDFSPSIIHTEPFPGFPTDVQAQMMAFMLTINGKSEIHEHIFENRFMHVAELQRMGADISLSGKVAHINGGRTLKGAPVMCTDLRASAALVLGALVADGETSISRIYHLDRGYEKLHEKLQDLGAQIQRVKE